MDNSKTKSIGITKSTCILKDREDSVNIKKTTLAKFSPAELDAMCNTRNRHEWTKDWIRKYSDEFQSRDNIMEETAYRKNEKYYYNSFLSINNQQFQYLVKLLAPKVGTLEPQRKRKPFSTEERLAIALKYLATGEFHSCRHYSFRASKPVILKMISDICFHIYEQLKDHFITLPKTEEQWQNVVKEFQRRNMDYPNCLGNLTMKRVKFVLTRAEKDIYHKELTPLHFTAIVDSHNNFMYVDVEKSTTVDNKRIFEHSHIKELIENNMLCLPGQQVKQSVDDDGYDNNVQYYFAEDANLPQKPYLVKLTDNSDMSYAENALHLISNYFPLLSQSLSIDKDHARKIILCCVALYNFLRQTDKLFAKDTENMIWCNDGADDLEDDDCIILENEEEKQEREEFTPKVINGCCFTQLFIQEDKGYENAINMNSTGGNSSTGSTIGTSNEGSMQSDIENSFP